jgi:hypothetical protein
VRRTATAVLPAARPKSAPEYRAYVLQPELRGNRRNEYGTGSSAGKKQVSAEMGFEQTNQKFPRKTPGVSGNGAKMGGNERFYEKSARAELSSERTEPGGSDCSRSGIWLN